MLHTYSGDKLTKEAERLAEQAKINEAEAKVMAAMAGEAKRKEMVEAAVKEEEVMLLLAWG